MHLVQSRWYPMAGRADPSTQPTILDITSHTQDTSGSLFISNSIIVIIILVQSIKIDLINLKIHFHDFYNWQLKVAFALQTNIFIHINKCQIALLLLSTVLLLYIICSLHWIVHPHQHFISILLLFPHVASPHSLFHHSRAVKMSICCHPPYYFVIIMHVQVLNKVNKTKI